MKKNINNTKYYFSVGEIEKIDSDALFLWTTSQLNAGDETFKRIHKEAGSILYDHCLGSLMKYGVKTPNGNELLAGQVVITPAGNLTQYNILHCVLPNFRTKTQFNNRKALLTNNIKLSMELIKTFEDVEIKLNTIAIPQIPSNIYGLLTEDDLKNYFKTLVENTVVKKIYFVFDNQEEMLKYFSVFNKMYTPFYERIINKLFKFTF